MHFPKYDYDDMVEAQRRMLIEGLGVTHLRLIMGTSMGCMHAFVWGETYPGFASALMPLACEPVEIAGLNRMWRQLAINGIEADPAWNGGNYTNAAADRIARGRRICCSSPARRRFIYQAQYPTRAAASALCRGQGRECASRQLDANDLIYQLDSSRNYNPWPKLEAIKVPLTWINSADDFINPRNLDCPAAGAEADADRALPADPGKRRYARPRHPHLGEILEGRPYRAAGAVGAVTSYAETWFTVISQRPWTLAEQPRVHALRDPAAALQPVLADQHRRVGREQIDLHIVEVELAAALGRAAIVADIMVERALPAVLELAARDEDDVGIAEARHVAPEVAAVPRRFHRSTVARIAARSVVGLAAARREEAQRSSLTAGTGRR